MKTFEQIFESIADYQSGLPRARSLLGDALEYIGSAAQEIKNLEEDHLDEWNRLGEIYGELKEFWAKL